MKVCTFFGHRDTPDEVQISLKKILIDLIVEKDIDVFLVGDEGNFDKVVLKTLIELKNVFSHISYAVVLAYFPKENKFSDKVNTLYPEGLELVPKRFAIHYRNNWMLKHCDYAVVYVNRNFGGAAKFADIASCRGIPTINLAK